ncbi:MAG: T9SS C-terminal target domain-containing protein [Porphyromonadaceae bacterium]|nr:MAG: T9SS C-terminal target domain-containing protein [Porphyromonadaceae bacterium]
MMKAISVSFLCYIISVSGITQNISVTFTGTGAAAQIDSVIATNLTTHKSITLPGNETLILTFNTGIPGVSELTNMGIVFPNPFTGKAAITTMVQKPQTVYVKVQNLVGQVVAQTKSFVQPGENEFALSVNTAGIYMVSLTSEQGTASYKVICSNATESENRIQYLGSGYNNHNNHNNPSQSGLKSYQTGYTLGYSLGNVIHYRCNSGIYTTIVTDSPISSKNYDVEFAACTDPDGKNYSIVAIGTQTWMTENLAYLPSVSASSAGSETSPYYYVHGYEGNSVDEAKVSPNYSAYGVLYNWQAAKIACPEGWHLPGDAEWDIVKDFLGSDAGRKMKSTSGWSSNGNGNNLSGFNALPGGSRNNQAGFIYLGYGTNFWSSSAYGSSGAWFRYLGNSDNGVYRYYGDRGEGFSVRCLKEATHTGPTARFTISPQSGTTSTIFQFDASGSTDTETAASDLEVRWDWNGDGTWDTGYDKTKTNSHQYSNPGGYLVILEVKNSRGLVDTKTKRVTVSNSILTDSRDGHEYTYKTIGSQTWMAENLAYLPSVGPSTATSETSPYYYVYNYEGTSISAAKTTNNYSIYGVLYNWTAAMNGASGSISVPSGIQGVCPEGWHLPSDAEWTILINYLGSAAGGKMKETGTTHWFSPNEGATNESGFTALPGGDTGYNGGFYYLGYNAYFWSASGYDASYAWCRGLYYDNDGVYLTMYPKAIGISVRCIKD